MTEHDDFDFNEDMGKLVWNEDVVYGSWYDGPSEDGTRTRHVSVSVPDGVQQNGTWIIHVFITKNGYPINPADKGYQETSITYQSKREELSLLPFCVCVILKNVLWKMYIFRQNYVRTCTVPTHYSYYCESIRELSVALFTLCYTLLSHTRIHTRTDSV